MIPIKFDGRIKAIGWQHPHPFDILRNGIWFGLDAQTIPTSSNYLLQRRIRPHLVAQQAVNDNISLVGVFVDGHGVKMGKIIKRLQPDIWSIFNRNFPKITCYEKSTFTPVFNFSFISSILSDL
jgi:hypothetical protein